MYVPVGKKVNEEYLENSAINHPDGFGFTYVENGKTKIYKDMKPERMHDVLRERMELFPDSPFIIHYRKMTHGTAVLENCHPFRIDGEHVFAHNGTVHPCKPDFTNTKNVSDTRVFNHEVLKELPDGWMKNRGIKRLIEDFIGKSKLAIMNNDKEVWLLNEKEGEWEDGVWYSNDSFRNDLTDWYSYNDKKTGTTLHYYTLDGIRCRWNPFMNETQAQSILDDRWYEFDTKKMEFVKFPKDKPKKSRVSADVFSTANQDNLIDFPDVDKEEETQMQECDWCKVMFPLEDIDEYELDEGVAWMCDECADTYTAITTHETMAKEGVIH
jgi:glutamine amidotransferase